MGYFRVYANKTNTIFRYFTLKHDVLSTLGENINTGATPVMEVMDGKGESQLLFSFEIPSWLQTKFTTYGGQVRLQLWDAGTLYEPAIKLKNLQLDSFLTDFVEGDGYSFAQPDCRTDVSNWGKRTSSNDWSDTTFSPVATHQLDRINEDLNFDVTTSITAALTNNANANFRLYVLNKDSAYDAIYRKFIHSRHTKTVFQPYLEFFLEDTVLDKTYNCYAKEENKIYLINQRGIDFSGVVTADITSPDGVTLDVPVSKERTGVYFVALTPSAMPLPTKKSIATIVWKIAGVAVQKQAIEIKSPDVLMETYDDSNLFFYATTVSTHNIVKQGDVLPFTVVSEVRGDKAVILNTYEYRITSADGFEMTPWTQCSVYRDKIYFNVNTAYFYPEQQYEVFVRNNTGDSILTSHLTYKFKVAMNDKSHMRQLTTSPYYSREQFFSK